MTTTPWWTRSRYGRTADVLFEEGDMSILLYLLSFGVIGMGVLLLTTAPLQGMIGGVICVSGTVLFVGAAIVGAITDLESVIKKQFASRGD